MTSTPFSGLMNDAASRLATIEAQVLQTTKLNLLQKVAGVWTQADDDLFADHTAYFIDCSNYGFPDLASRFWESTLSREAAAADFALSKQTPPSRIHKGAPLYNTGLGYLLAGNLDKAVAFISEAGNEEQRRGNPSGNRLFIGDHGLTDQSVIDPICSEWLPEWIDDFKNVCGLTLDKPEFKKLTQWLSATLENAIQLVTCLTRLRIHRPLPDNPAVRHLQIQNLADIVLVIESSLRQWQSIQGQLFDRMKSMVSVSTNAEDAFNAAHLRFTTAYPNNDPVTRLPNPDKETATALNWAIDDAISALSAASDHASCAGIVCYLAVRIRNSLMHVIDGTVSLYSDHVKRNRVTSLMISCIALSRAGSDGSLASL